MSNNDPWSLLRARDEFTLDEAARIVSGVPHGRKYPAMRPDWTQELRDEKGALEATSRELIESVVELGVEVRSVPNKSQERRIVSTGLGDMWEPIRHAAPSIGTHLEYGRVKRDALKDWCDARALRPVFFYPVGTDDGGANFAPGVSEAKSNRVIAVLALLLAEKSGPSFKRGEKPNVSQIAEAVAVAAKTLYGEDVKGFEQCRKRLAAALKEFPDG